MRLCPELVADGENRLREALAHRILCARANGRDISDGMRQKQSQVNFANTKGRISVSCKPVPSH